MDWVTSVVSAWPINHGTQLGVIGSSLGGFYATHMAHHMSCRAVLINPAVNPGRLLAQHVGEQRSFHGDEGFFFRSEFVDELQALETGPLREPEKLMVWVARGDEVLDWREMAARYEKTRLRVQDGGDHAMSSYSDHLPEIMAFLGWPSH